MLSTESTSHLPLRAPRRWALASVLLLALPLAAQAGRVYVTNEDGQSVSVIDTDKAEVVSTVPIGKRPRGLKLSHDGKYLFVAVSGLPKCPPGTPDEVCDKLQHDVSADGIAVMDTAKLKITKVVKSGSDPEQFDVSPDGKLLFIANEDAGTLTVANVATGAIDKSVKVGKEPEGVRVTPDGKWIVVTSEGGNAIYVVDLHTYALKTTIPVGKRPRDAAFTSDSRTAYISGEFDGSIYSTGIPDGPTASKMLQLRKDARPMGVIMDAAHKRLFVSTGRGGTVAVVSVDGEPKLVTEIAVGPRPWGIALAKDGKLLYTANGPSNDVSVVDTDSLKVINKIPVGNSPWGVVVGP